jgi:hypothetical protein
MSAFPPKQTFRRARIGLIYLALFFRPQNLARLKPSATATLARRATLAVLTVAIRAASATVALALSTLSLRA